MTLKSMTGFARADGKHGEATWHWEARSVNGRNLDLRLRLPSGFEALEIKAVPATYHNRPERIAPAVARRIRAARGRYRKIFVAYADCGTGGALDRLLAAEQIERLPGAHCYAFFSGVEAFAARAEEDLRAFFLTDFLIRHFRTLIIEGLGLDRHPLLGGRAGRFHDRPDLHAVDLGRGDAEAAAPVPQHGIRLAERVDLGQPLVESGLTGGVHVERIQSRPLLEHLPVLLGIGEELVERRIE